MIPFENFWEQLAFSLIRAQTINHWTINGKKSGHFQAPNTMEAIKFIASEDDLNEN